MSNSYIFAQMRDVVYSIHAASFCTTWFAATRFQFCKNQEQNKFHIIYFTEGANCYTSHFGTITCINFNHSKAIECFPK